MKGEQKMNNFYSHNEWIITDCWGRQLLHQKTRLRNNVRTCTGVYIVENLRQAKQLFALLESSKIH